MFMQKGFYSGDASPIPDSKTVKVQNTLEEITKSKKLNYMKRFSHFLVMISGKMMALRWVRQYYKAFFYSNS